MREVLTADIDVSIKDISGLTSPDAVAAFLTRLGYPTDHREPLLPSTLGLSPETADAIRGMELLARDSENFFRVILVQLRSLTAKARNELARNLGKRNADHLVILTRDFDAIEFMLIDKETAHRNAPGGGPSVRIVPRVVALQRKATGLIERRILRRLTWTGKDGLDQFSKLRSVFESARYCGQYFQNRALFADHYLETRLREDAAWRDRPNSAFAQLCPIMRDARARFTGKDEQVVRNDLFEPIWKLLGFKAKASKDAKQDHAQPDYTLHGEDGKLHTVAFCYRWDRWLDGPDLNDPDTPEENPGAAVVSALARGDARWIIVTNGKYWRLYSKDAHSRSTNFYEVDLEEALVASAETDPNEAFRYWWLFFRREAFAPTGPADQPTCWLDEVVRGSRDYAKRLGDRLKNRVFIEIFPHLATGFLEDRERRMKITKQPSEEDLRDVFEATLTLLYRLLFLLYAESRDLLPVRETAYREASLQTLKGEVAERAGAAESEVSARLNVYSETETALYDRLLRLFRVMDQGDPILNVPCYNGGLFLSQPTAHTEERERRIAQFLLNHKVPDRSLALAIDRMARDQDERTLGLVSIDFKSLEVRHLGNIYEGLLEFKLKIAEEDLGVTTEKKTEKYIPLSQIKAGRGRRGTPEAAVRQGDVYLSNDKADRKATGSYYTPDSIVEYIVEHTVGPVLDDKLNALRSDLEKAGKTYRRHLANSKSLPASALSGMDGRTFAASQTYGEYRDLVDCVFGMKVLDPAMGSAHFLVEAVDFLTDRLLDFLNRFPHNPVRFMLDKTRRTILDALGEQNVTVDPDKLTDINLLKRHVLKRCIYGVDLNPMAVELAKVSLWLDAFTLGAPLSFLDHHLRCGNSLVGEQNAREHIFAGSGLEADLCRAVHHMIDIAGSADANPADVAASKTLYAEVERLATPFKNRLHIETGELFAKVDSVSKAAMLRYPNDTKFDPATPRPGFERSHAAYLRVLESSKAQRFFHWEIEFPEVFFGFVDVNQRQIKYKEDLSPGSGGFDAVIGNPPYDVLAEKELDIDLSCLMKYLDSQSVFLPAKGGKQNLYKLFVCRSLNAVRRDGRIGQIVPMALLGDEQAAGVRKMLLKSASLIRVEAFPQKDDPANRVFEEAKLSTCIFIAANSDKREAFTSRVHPAKEIDERSPSTLLHAHELALYDSDNEPIIACSQADWDLIVRISQSKRVKRLGDYCEFFQGEINETNERRNGTIGPNANAGAKVLRASALCLYVVREPSQNTTGNFYLDAKRFFSGKSSNAKAFHLKEDRVGVQGNAPQNNFRRLIAAEIASGTPCFYTINYLPGSKSKLPLRFVLALLNSKLADWWFRLGSSNAHANQYQLAILPSPTFDNNIGPNAAAIGKFRRALTARDWDIAKNTLDEMIGSPPFPNAILEIAQELVDSIIRIETVRGDIIRSDRSALDVKAQPFQDLIDHMVYRMAGLTDSDITGLEERLARML